eukprot:TRINITY_DN5030_c0_g1_i3.p1 TRINITY_DN5030_c0_g1~~TRINITY_DN5030_c0_g1_i3.p1  ORF type:complete len:332 (+),score=70.68 TRINITY_DN5030_c0_g1_i3:1-996(+)
MLYCVFFFFKQKTAYEMLRSLVGSEMCIRDSIRTIFSKEGKEITSIFMAEIGGMNSLSPLYTAALLGLPLIDADTMGRAYPEVQMCSHFIQGVKAVPSTCSDEKGNVDQLMTTETDNVKEVETFLRNFAIAHGLFVGVSFAPITKQQILEKTIHFSLSRAWRLGKSILEARHNMTSPLDAIQARENGKLAFQGKLTYLFRHEQGGFTKGVMHLEGFDQYVGKKVRIDFQNENLILADLLPGDEQNPEGKRGEVYAVVPDLICLVDNENYQPILTEDLRFGLRVSVILIPSAPMMETPQALEVVGPKCFGYPDVVHKRIGGFVAQHLSLIHI